VDSLLVIEWSCGCNLSIAYKKKRINYRMLVDSLLLVEWSCGFNSGVILLLIVVTCKWFRINCKKIK
jgi:hypothetical protein